MAGKAATKSAAKSTGQRPLEGEIAIVTGAGINSGSVFAKTLAAAGAAVVVNYRNAAAGAIKTVEEILAAGDRAIAVKGDVTKPDDVKALVAAAVEAFGSPTILVNNAGIRSFRPISDLSIEEFRATVSTTLDGAFLCCKEVVPHMRKAGHGTIVNIGGGSGHHGRAERVHVSAAKAGLAGLTVALAREVAADNITVNCIVPGKVDTGQGGVRPERIPTGRGAMPWELGELIVFLAGKGCRQMTGQMLHVNGGTLMSIA